MKHRKLFITLTLLLMLSLLTTTAFAIDESEVESAITAAGEEAVAGNLFIWFLCAVAFLKISQKIDSFMSSLGVNVGRTGGSMLGELLIAGRALGAAAKTTGGAVGNIFNRSHSSTSAQAAGQAFTGGGNGLIGIAKRAAGNAAASSTTNRGTGLGSVIGGAMFASSMNSGGKFATDVVGAIATGNISSVGSMKGEKAAQALTSYLGYGSGNASTPGHVQSPASDVADGTTVGSAPNMNSEMLDAQAFEGADIITPDGGSTAAAAYVGQPHQATEGQNSVPQQPPTFRDVEIGGGRITGYETFADSGEERQFAMYNANQYMAPTGEYETVQTADGESWYKQYAQPVVEKTPYKESSGKIRYHEQIVDQMPQVPKRKDRI